MPQAAGSTSSPRLQLRFQRVCCQPFENGIALTEHFLRLCAGSRKHSMDIVMTEAELEHLSTWHRDNGVNLRG